MSTRQSFWSGIQVDELTTIYFIGSSVSARIAGLIYPPQALTCEELTCVGKLDLRCYSSRSYRPL